MAHFTRGIQRIGIDHHQACPQRAKYGDGVLKDIGHLHGNAITGLEISVLLQVSGKRGAVTLKLGVGQGHAKVTEGRTVSELLAGAFKHIDDRGEGRHIDVQRDTGGAFVIPEIRLHYFYPHT